MNKSEFRFGELLIALLGLFMIASSLSCVKRPGSNASIPYEEIEIEPLFYLDSLDPAVEIAPFDKFFAVEQDQYIYFCDARNHRILKYDLEGRFIREIGGLGQGTNDLYWPYGIALASGEIVVLNSAGREIKIFNESGLGISKFEMPGARESQSLVAAGDIIVTDMKYEDEKRIRRQKLLTSYTAKGDRLLNFGRSVSSNSMSAQLAFNTTRLGLAGSRVFGAFYVYPAVFGYRLDGREIFYRLLTDLRIPEFDTILGARQSEMNPSEPDYQGDSLRVTFLCANILARSEDSFIYALNHFPDLIAFNGKGMPTKRIHLKYGITRIYSRSFALGQGGTIYGIIYADKDNKTRPMLVKVDIAE